MLLSNEELKKIYFGAYEFEETPEGFLKANQYTKAQMVRVLLRCGTRGATLPRRRLWS